ncbi:MAG: DUF4190 domain-containing protein [Phycisphaerales bacterium]|nr:DUF4190 domain-containing protein [Phycisphaerales bacterium]
MSEIPPPFPEPRAPENFVAPQAAKLPSGMAKTTFFLGLFGFIPLCGLVAIILGIVALNRACGCGKRGLAIAGIVLGAFCTFVLPALLVPAVQRSVELANQASCKANLSGIGKGVILFKVESPNGQYPKDIQPLIDSGLVHRGAFDCPSAEPGHRSYFWCFPKDTRGLSDRAFMACDLKGNHPGDGRAVLYVAGIVDFVSEEKFQTLLAGPENAEFARAMKAEGLE